MVNKNKTHAKLECKIGLTRSFLKVGTVYLDETSNVAFDIMPIVIETADRKKRSSEDYANPDTFDSTQNRHALFKRQISNKDTELTDIVDFVPLDGLFTLYILFKKVIHGI